MKGFLKNHAHFLFCYSFMILKYIYITLYLIFTLFHQMNGSTNKKKKKNINRKHDNEQNTSSIYISKH